MKVFECVKCENEVKLRKLPEEYKCPKCGADKEYLIEKEKLKKPIFILLLYSLTLIMLIISASFTISTIYNQSKIPYYNAEVGEVSLELVQEKDTTIRLYNTYPMSDEKAMNLKPFLFNLNNTGTYSLNYTLRLENVPDSELDGIDEIIGKTRISNSKVKFSLINTDTNEVVKQGFVSELKNEILSEGKLSARANIPYALRLWIDKDVGNEDQNKFYVGRIVLKVYEDIDCDDDDNDYCDDDD